LEKIVFVQPKVGFQGASFWDALGLGYIISYIKASGFSGQIEFYSGAFDPDETIVKACEDADFVGFSCTSPQLKHALQLASKIKMVNPECKTILGGWHPTSMPSSTLRQSNVDYVVVGEGEEGMLRLLNGEAKERIVHSEPIKNLDMLPWSDRDAIKVERHIQLAYRENGERITSIMGTRGCPFRCVYCSEFLMTRGLIRMRTPSKLVDEVEYVVDKYKIDLLKFVDAEINKSVGWVKNLCRELMDRRVDVEFEANIHAAFADKEMFQLMRRAGFRQINIGVESGSPRILKAMRKGTTINQIRNVFKWSKQAGLLRRAYFMVGMPEETPEDVKLTFKLAEEIEPDWIGCTILCPYPGTEIYMRDPDRFKDWDWSVCDEYGNPYWRTEAFSNEDLKAIQKSFMEKFKDRLCYRCATYSRGFC
jgi:radical SAM superfamily enzyme YgiQ (UPF0313 family)